MAKSKRSLAAAFAFAAMLGLDAAQAQPTAQTAPTIPDVTLAPRNLSIDGAKDFQVVIATSGDADADATLAAGEDAGAQGPRGVESHEGRLQQVLGHMPKPFVRLATENGQPVYRADTLDDCKAFAAALAARGRTHRLVCRGNPYPTAGFYLGTYYNEIGQPDRALTALEQGLIAAPNSPLLIAERNASFTSLHRWDDALAGADRGLAIAGLAPSDHALMLRNRGFALVQLGRLDEGQKAYEDSLVLVPDNALAKNELEYIARLKAGAHPTAPTILLPNKPKSN